MSSILEQSIGSWSWTPTQVGTCVDPFGFPWLMRAFCNNHLYGLGGGTQGVLPEVVVDPNGAYIRFSDGQYAQGRWGTNIGPIYLMYSINVTAPNFGQCYYEAFVNLYFMSFANIRDTFADCGNSQFPLDIPGTGGIQCGGSQVAGWTYRKPCQSPFDSVLGTYEILGEQDQDSYQEDSRCGRSGFYIDIRASAGPTLTIS